MRERGEVWLRGYVDQVVTGCAGARLIELERIDRERRIKAAKFSAVKSLDSFDFKAILALTKMQVLEPARCDWPYGD